MVNYQEFAQSIIPDLEQTIDQKLKETVDYSDLRQAMGYSINVGGKRLRPLLLLSVVASFNEVQKQDYLPAAALELIHTYSLIHDDLPAMDNDDYRRGQLSNHKKFGEAQAILAGDGLLTLAFQWLSQSEQKPQVITKLIELLSYAAGPSQMVAGQYMDIQSTHQKIDLKTLETMDHKKTAALLNAAVLMGATIADVSTADYQALDTFSKKFGLAFQIADDINDFENGQDELEQKATFATMLGLGEAKLYLQKVLAEAQASLNKIKNQDLTLLESYFEYFRQVK